MSKPQEHESMPQHQHYPLAKHLEDRNPKYHEEQYKETLHEFPPHIPLKLSKGKRSISTNEMISRERFFLEGYVSFQGSCDRT
jgi:hypothetical protein